MNLDDEMCLCFHVTKRKLLSFLRVEQPRRAAQLSECFGAGTGCGWCRGYLRRLFEAQANAEAAPPADPSFAEHNKGRAGYLREGRGTPPPGATPSE